MLDYTSFPNAYVPCFLEQCTIRETCLHWMYGLVLPDEVTIDLSVTPRALLEKNFEDGRCRHYAEAKKVTVCADFSLLFDKVRKEDYKYLRQDVYDYLGGRHNYRRYSIHQRPYLITPEKANDIAKIFAKYGYEPPRYGETFETYIF